MCTPPEPCVSRFLTPRRTGSPRSLSSRSFLGFRCVSLGVLTSVFFLHPLTHTLAGPSQQPEHQRSGPGRRLQRIQVSHCSFGRVLLNLNTGQKNVTLGTTRGRTKTAYERRPARTQWVDSSDRHTFAGSSALRTVQYCYSVQTSTSHSPPFIDGIRWAGERHRLQKVRVPCNRA